MSCMSTRLNRRVEKIIPVIEPVKGKLEAIYQNTGNFLESMYFEEEGHCWSSIARNFVLENRNHNLKNIVEEIMKAKIEIE